MTVEELRRLPLRESCDWGVIEFSCESFCVKYVKKNHCVSVGAFEGYSGFFPDGIGIGSMIGEAEAKGWFLHLDYEGWVNRLYPGFLIQNELDDPDLGEAGKGCVCGIFWTSPSLKLPNGAIWGDPIYGSPMGARDERTRGQV